MRASCWRLTTNTVLTFAGAATGCSVVAAVAVGSVNGGAAQAAGARGGSTSARTMYGSGLETPLKPEIWIVYGSFPPCEMKVTASSWVLRFAEMPTTVWPAAIG